MSSPEGLPGRSYDLKDRRRDRSCFIRDDRFHRDIHVLAQRHVADALRMYSSHVRWNERETNLGSDEIERQHKLRNGLQYAGCEVVGRARCTQTALQRVFRVAMRNQQKRLVL